MAASWWSHYRWYSRQGNRQEKGGVTRRHRACAYNIGFAAPPRCAQSTGQHTCNTAWSSTCRPPKHDSNVGVVADKLAYKRLTYKRKTKVDAARRNIRSAIPRRSPRKQRGWGRGVWGLGGGWLRGLPRKLSLEMASASFLTAQTWNPQRRSARANTCRTWHSTCLGNL